MFARLDVTFTFDLTTGLFEGTYQYGDLNDIILTFDRGLTIAELTIGLRAVLNIDVSGRSDCLSKMTQVFEHWRRICVL